MLYIIYCCCTTSFVSAELETHSGLKRCAHHNYHAPNSTAIGFISLCYFHVGPKRKEHNSFAIIVVTLLPKKRWFGDLPKQLTKISMYMYSEWNTSLTLNNRAVYKITSDTMQWNKCLGLRCSWLEDAGGREIITVKCQENGISSVVEIVAEIWKLTTHTVIL